VRNHAISTIGDSGNTADFLPCVRTCLDAIRILQRFLVYFRGAAMPGKLWFRAKQSPPQAGQGPAKGEGMGVFPPTHIVSMRDYVDAITVSGGTVEDTSI